MQAAYFEQENSKVRCRLCPHHCLIADGKTGICRVRRNVNGSLQVESYGRISAIHLDPVEKKPLYHFYPGHKILSLGSFGCNLHCTFCQNCDISQTGVQDYLEEVTVDTIVHEAASIPGNIGVAFTYNEPVIFFEFVMDTASAVHKSGLKNVLVTNGYIEQDPLEELIPRIDAFNVDLKAFTDAFYVKQTNAHLEPVKQTLKTIRRHNKHLELTNLVIPGLNDSLDEFETMTDWISGELGKNTIFHISKYYPGYKLNKPPTPESILQNFYEIASKKLNYVYVGNTNMLSEGNNTLCHNCSAIVIKRDGYHTDISGLTRSGNCFVCGSNIISCI